MSESIPKRIPECAARLIGRRPWFEDPAIAGRAKLREASLLARFLSSERFAGKPILAITLGRTIHFRQVESYDPHTPKGLALLAHELKHIEQYEREGLLGFAWQYVRAWREHGYGSEIPFEAEGSKIQHAVEGHLTSEFAANPGVEPCAEMAPPHTPNAAFALSEPPSP